MWFETGTFARKDAHKRQPRKVECLVSREIIGLRIQFHPSQFLITFDQLQTWLLVHYWVPTKQAIVMELMVGAF